MIPINGGIGASPLSIPRMCGGDPYYLPMAILEMQQGFGRLIRTSTDMGVVMLCDKRIITKPYGGKFLRSLPQTLRTSKIDKVKLFFDIVNKKRIIYKARNVIK